MFTFNVLQMTNKVKARSILPWIKVQQLHIGTKDIIEIMRVEISTNM